MHISVINTKMIEFTQVNIIKCYNYDNFLLAKAE